MITYSLTYEIDPAKVTEFGVYARVWVRHVEKLGGTHHGCWLPHEGSNDIAYWHFSFPSLAAYEDYRARMAGDPECRAAYAHAQQTGCIQRHVRSFTRPILEGGTPEALA